MDTDCNASPVPLSFRDGSPHESPTAVCPPLNVIRYLLWPVGPFHIDIRVESTNQSDLYKVAGQVVHSLDDPQPQPGITVSLFSALSSEGAELARTKTDQHGEFSIEHRHPGNLQLRLAFTDEIYASINIGQGVYRDTR